jgi:hypothetical protein
MSLETHVFMRINIIVIRFHNLGEKGNAEAL